MNITSLADFKARFVHRLRYRSRTADLQRRSSAFSNGREVDAVQRIHVINLDRIPGRWRRLQKELARFEDRHGNRLTTITRRFSAIDARYMTVEPKVDALIPWYTLADQLSISPNAKLVIDEAARAHKIGMTRQEIAVALSHIKVWKLVADGDVSCALILEDDVFMPRGFARNLDKTWSQLNDPSRGDLNFDLLYLSFKDVGQPAPANKREVVRRLEPGLWQASGYVLTRGGAQKLLELLPVRGPIDLWLNLQFARLNVFTSKTSIIEQRIDEPSTNSYSVLPVLSQLGVVTREKPLVHTNRALRGPIIAFGNERTGLTALSTALAMLGYTCISDLDRLPTAEHEAVLLGKRGLFNAFVNIGTLNSAKLSRIAQSNRRALFIATSLPAVLTDVTPERILHLDATVADKWLALSDFLTIDYPSFPYPQDIDLGQRVQVAERPSTKLSTSLDLKADRSPWILRSQTVQWRGISIHAVDRGANGVGITWVPGAPLDENVWRLRSDTFPSNLALFRPENFVTSNTEAAVLELKADRTRVRDFSSAAIASNAQFLYGRFSAELRASDVPGVITGMFLHRNGPRQEIDIEFVGRDTTKMLINVYYNPGPAGTILEYGYRGTPSMIDLGFDAARAVHTYEIDWQPGSIKWLIDGSLVYERVMWDPTPIPDQPLEFNVNLWHSRSTELAGNLDGSRLPAVVELRSITLRSERSSVAESVIS